MEISIIRLAARVVAATAAVFALIFAAGIVEGDSAVALSHLVYPAVALGVGVLLIMGALHRERRDRVAWALFGAGVIFAGLGDAVRAWYELVIGVDPSISEVPDIFYLAAYPIFAAAILITPRIAANRLQRAQQVLDGVVVTAGVSALVWVTALRPIYGAVDASNVADLLSAGAYPIGDILLVATIGTAGLSRSIHVRDRALWCVVGGLLLIAFGDLVYLTQTWSGSYQSGTWVDATWLASYGLFALAATWLPEPTEPRLPRDRRLPLWHLATPVSVLMLISGLHMAGKFFADADLALVFTIGLTSLGMMVLARVVLVVAEDRSLVDVERRQLISVVSHELRTPLTAVQGYLELVTDMWGRLSDSERKYMVGVAREQSELITRIVTDLISTSRDTLHAAELRIEERDLDRLLGEIIATLEGATVPIQTSLGAQAAVRVDPERIQQVVSNILTNADKYGGGRIHVVTRQLDEQVEIAVHDDGPGVPARFRQLIWDRFERGPHRLDASTPGSGLGLSVARSLVAAHGGEVGYRTSELLGGACFWVHIPCFDGRRSPSVDQVEAVA